MKTDRRDAEKLARCFRAGELTAVWVPTKEQEALRDLVRRREAATKDQLRVRHQLGKFSLRHEQRPTAMKAHLEWIKTHVHFAESALESELGCLTRFATATDWMGYSGLVARESTGNRVQRGGITKTGNAHLRRVVVGGILGVSAPAECNWLSIAAAEELGTE